MKTSIEDLEERLTEKIGDLEEKIDDAAAEMGSIEKTIDRIDDAAGKIESIDETVDRMDDRVFAVHLHLGLRDRHSGL